MPRPRERVCLRQTWGRQVAYQSQFHDATNRAHAGQARIKARLCSIGGLDPDDWDSPPKPKGMRWQTYNRYERQYDRYDEILDSGLFKLAAKFLRK